MKLRAKMLLAAGALVLVSIIQGFVSYQHSSTTMEKIGELVQHKEVFALTVTAMAKDFYVYDDQMNMYVLLAALHGQQSLANQTYTQARVAGIKLSRDVQTARSVAHDPAELALLGRVSRDLASYTQYAQQVRQAVLLHQMAKAVQIQTIGNIAPSNDIMATLSKLRKMGDSVIEMGSTMIQNDQRSAVTLNLILSGALIVVIMGVLWLMERMVVKPSREMAGVAERISRGETDVAIQYRSGDEIGALADSFRRMVSYLQRLGAAAEAIGRGDLTRKPEVAGEKDELGHAVIEMHRRIREVIEGLRDSSRTVDDNAGVLRQLAQETNQATQQISVAVNQTAQATNEQSHGLQQITVTMQQLKTAVDQVAAGTDAQLKASHDGLETLNSMKMVRDQMDIVMKSVEEIVEASQRSTGQSRSQVEETLKAMARMALVTRDTSEAISQLGKHSEEIGTIVATISDIAAQTNLLALNANIEAARAGEHGRGFAVVADEVRKLAEQSAQASKNIGDLIHTIQGGVAASVESMEKGEKEVAAGQMLAERTRGALNEMEQSVGNIVSKISQLIATVTELDASSRDVGMRIAQVSDTARDNSRAAQAMAHSSDEVSDTIQGLAAISEETAASTEQVAATSSQVAQSSSRLEEQASSLLSVVKQLNTFVSGYQL